MCRGQIGLVTSKVITRITSLHSSLVESQYRIPKCFLSDYQRELAYFYKLAAMALTHIGPAFSMYPFTTAGCRTFPPGPIPPDVPPGRFPGWMFSPPVSATPGRFPLRCHVTCWSNVAWLRRWQYVDVWTVHCIYHSDTEYYTLDLVVILSEVNSAAVFENVKWSYFSNLTTTTRPTNFHQMNK